MADTAHAAAVAARNRARAARDRALKGDADAAKTVRDAWQPLVGPFDEQVHEDDPQGCQ